MNQSFIHLKNTCITFPPYDPHKTMRDYTPTHLSFADIGYLRVTILERLYKIECNIICGAFPFLFRVVDKCFVVAALLLVV